MDIQSAVDRLNSQLPLKDRQDQLSPQLKKIHQQVLTSLIKQGRAPTAEELESQVIETDVKAAVRELGRADLVVLDPQGEWPVGAYPVTVESTPHTVTVNGHDIHAMCALDAVSIAPMFDEEVTIESACHVSKEPIRIRMRGKDILEAQPADAVVGIRWQMPSDVAAHSMCMEMVFLKDRATAEAWQGEDTENTSLFTLPEAVQFGRDFFLPLMR